MKKRFCTLNMEAIIEKRQTQFREEIGVQPPPAQGKWTYQTYEIPFAGHKKEYKLVDGTGRVFELKPLVQSGDMILFNGLTLKVIEIRAEPLQAITNEDAFLEGIDKKHYLSQGISSPESMEEFAHEEYSRKGFRELWQSAWIRNPWVFVISFKHINL